MAIFGLRKGSDKQSKVREKSGNFEMDIEWQPCTNHSALLQMLVRCLKFLLWTTERLYEPRCEKACLRVSYNFQHKPGCTATENG